MYATYNQRCGPSSEDVTSVGKLEVRKFCSGVEGPSGILMDGRIQLEEKKKKGNLGKGKIRAKAWQWELGSPNRSGTQKYSKETIVVTIPTRGI